MESESENNINDINTILVESISEICACRSDVRCLSAAFARCQMSLHSTACNGVCRLFIPEAQNYRTPVRPEITIVMCPSMLRRSKAFCRFIHEEFFVTCISRLVPMTTSATSDGRLTPVVRYESHSRHLADIYASNLDQHYL